ncbi:MAG TPA: hypothetical protein VFA18_04355, partial [Gemmataceae bacterium]|nr:hypothetical protein [Gemmataceae bacterium]
MMQATLAEAPSKEAGRLTSDDTHGSLAQALLNELLATSVVLTEDWEALSADKRAELGDCADTRQLLTKLVEQRLLTRYQADRI